MIPSLWLTTRVLSMVGFFLSVYNLKANTLSENIFFGHINNMKSTK